MESKTQVIDIPHQVHQVAAISAALGLRVISLRMKHPTR
jgi:hypothetical protein